MIKTQLEIFKEISPNKPDWIIQIVFTHELSTVYGTKEYTSGLCESYCNLIDMSEEYNWDKCDIIQCTIYSNKAIVPITGINGLKLSQFVKLVKEI